IAGGRIACSVEHGHLHLVPSKVDIWPALEDRLVWHALDDGSLTETVDGREYLRYRTPAGSWHIAITDGDPIPSQLMRQVFASALGEPSVWNWRDFPQPTRADRAWRRL